MKSLKDIWKDALFVTGWIKTGEQPPDFDIHLEKLASEWADNPDSFKHYDKLYAYMKKHTSTKSRNLPSWF